MTNKYSGKCYYCGETVDPGDGYCWRAGRRWSVAHSDCRPGAGGKSERKVRREVAEGTAAFQETFRQKERVSDVFNIGGKEYYRNKRGRCEDAPCCGCCTI